VAVAVTVRVAVAADNVVLQVPVVLDQAVAEDNLRIHTI
jgi:hypothetical protein